MGLDAFDHIVALSPQVDAHIRSYYPQVTEKLISWDIDDPYQDGPDAFERCARQIEVALRQEFMSLIDGRDSTSGEADQEPDGRAESSHD